MEIAHAEHGALTKAIIDGDSEGAERIMSEHVAGPRNLRPRTRPKLRSVRGGTRVR
jgi:DNA-binding GntR family transcriptional regulator